MARPPLEVVEALTQVKRGQNGEEIVTGTYGGREVRESPIAWWLSAAWLEPGPRKQAQEWKEE